MSTDPRGPMRRIVTVEHPETHALHIAGSAAIDQIEQQGPEAEAVAVELEQERNRLYGMVWDECSNERAAARAEWYAKVMRAHSRFCL
jgi:hypothetical protein